MTSSQVFLVALLNVVANPLLPTILFAAATTSSGPRLSSRVYTEDYTVSLRSSLVSKAAWDSGRLPVSLEKSLVSCATSCVNDLRTNSWQIVGACDSIMFDSET